MYIAQLLASEKNTSDKAVPKEKKINLDWAC
jgi:hypothetical protein